jgi:hypothetical protein
MYMSVLKEKHTPSKNPSNLREKGLEDSGRIAKIKRMLDNGQRHRKNSKEIQTTSTPNDPKREYPQWSRQFCYGKKCPMAMGQGHNREIP